MKSLDCVSDGNDAKVSSPPEPGEMDVLFTRGWKNESLSGKDGYSERFPLSRLLFE